MLVYDSIDWFQAVEYRLLQHAPFPAAVQDAAAVYAHVLGKYGCLPDTATHKLAMDVESTKLSRLAATLTCHITSAKTRSGKPKT